LWAEAMNGNPRRDASPFAAALSAAQRGWNCSNCRSAGVARFCAQRGQATVLQPPTVRQFIHRFLRQHVALEGPLRRTLTALLLEPGRLPLRLHA